MKVPKMYKSSDRYNAGVDVIYDDDSKLQFAPFICATTQSGDNGADDGGDEEGEDIMVVTLDSVTNSIDKSFKDLKDAVNVGKIVMLKREALNDDKGYKAYFYYLTVLDNENAGKYYAHFCGGTYDEDDGAVLNGFVFTADNDTANMTIDLPS